MLILVRVGSTTVKNFSFSGRRCLLGKLGIGHGRLPLCLLNVSTFIITFLEIDDSSVLAVLGESLGLIVHFNVFSLNKLPLVIRENRLVKVVLGL